jgi:hypothetical protein
MTTTLAYYATVFITTMKSFMIQAQFFGQYSLSFWSEKEFMCGRIESHIFILKCHHKNARNSSCCFAYNKIGQIIFVEL